MNVGDAGSVGLILVLLMMLVVAVVTASFIRANQPLTAKRKESDELELK